MLDKIRTSFIEELIKDGDTWRVLRSTTLYDLIVVNYNDYSRTSNPQYLIDLFNNCIKLKLLNIISNIDTSSSLQNVIGDLNKNNPLIVDYYDKIFEKIVFNFSKDDHRKDNLFSQIEYFKVVCNIEVNDINEDFIESIAIAVLYTLIGSMDR